jgi:hypothetical protein
MGTGEDKGAIADKSKGTGESKIKGVSKFEGRSKGAVKGTVKGKGKINCYCSFSCCIEISFRAFRYFLRSLQ